MALEQAFFRKLQGVGVVRLPWENTARNVLDHIQLIKKIRVEWKSTLSRVRVIQWVEVAEK